MLNWYGMHGPQIGAMPQAAVPWVSLREGFAGIDVIRRWLGDQLDERGFGPRPTPSEILLSGPVLRLHAYRRGPVRGPALLLVPAPIKRAYIWDLAPGASVVRRCLDHGFRPFLLEWTDPGTEASDFGLAQYADTLIGDCLDAIAAETGEARSLVAGHSLGGTLAAIFTALHPDRVRGLLLLEAPLCFGEEAGAFAPAIAALPPSCRTGAALGKVPGSFLDVVSVAAAPGTFEWSRWIDAFRCAADSEALALHLRVERWMLDELALPGRLFDELVEQLYREDCFRRGTLVIRGRRALPAKLVAPLLTVLDPRSAIIPPGSVLPVHLAAPSHCKRLFRYEGDMGVALDHVGVLVGRNAHRLLWPEILDWLQTTEPRASRRMPPRASRRAAGASSRV